MVQTTKAPHQTEVLRLIESIIFVIKGLALNLHNLFILFKYHPTITKQSVSVKKGIKKMRSQKQLNHAPFWVLSILLMLNLVLFGYFMYAAHELTALFIEIISTNNLSPITWGAIGWYAFGAVSTTIFIKGYYLKTLKMLWNAWQPKLLESVSFDGK